jgi:hypothetical protein
MPNLTAVTAEGAQTLLEESSVAAFRQSLRGVLRSARACEASCSPRRMQVTMQLARSGTPLMTRDQR